LFRALVKIFRRRLTKALIVYYSLDGNSGLIADILKSEMNADVLRLETLDEKKRKGLARYFWGGRQVFTHANPPLKPYSVSLDAYDLIIIGGPVWAASPAPALNSFLGETKITGKKIAVFFCHGGGKGSAPEKLKASLSGNTFAGEIDFINPLKGNREEIAARLREWAKQLL
jgi:flavodoxin